MSAEYGMEEILDICYQCSWNYSSYSSAFSRVLLSQSEEIYECRRGTQISGTVVSSEQNWKVHRGRVEVSCYMLSPCFAIAEQILGEHT